jgi:integrase
MPVYRGRREGTWRVTVWKAGAQSEWVVEGTKRDAQRLERQEQARASERAVRRAPTFADFASDLYEPYAKAQFGANTWKRTRRYTVARLVRSFGPTRLDAIQPAQVERFRQQRLADGMKTTSINAELRTLKAMLNWAAGEMALPVAKLKIKMLPEDGAKRVKAWTADEVRRLLAIIQEMSPHIYCLVRFMLNTGVRKGEAIASEWSWVDEADKLLRIPVNDYWSPKDGEPREVPIDVVLPMLLSMPRVGPSIFVAPDGTQYAGAPYAVFPDKTFQKCVKAAGLTGGPHSTRHTYASHFLRAMPDMSVLAKVLGHSRTRITETYAHMLPGHMDQARMVVNL